jgi:hypothetical protein
MPAVADGGRSIVAALEVAVAVDAYAERPFVAVGLEGLLPVAVDGETHVGLLLVARSAAGGGCSIGPADDDQCSSGTRLWGESRAQS